MTLETKIDDLEDEWAKPEALFGIVESIDEVQDIYLVKHELGAHQQNCHAISAAVLERFAQIAPEKAMGVAAEQGPLGVRAVARPLMHTEPSVETANWWLDSTIGEEEKGAVAEEIALI